MHEYAATRNILNIAQEHARQHGARAVERIHLRVGDDSGYLAEAIELYFDLIAAGTPCEHAKLCITRVKPKLRCENCGALFVRRPFCFDCPDCRGDGAPTEIGREFIVESIVLGEAER